MPCCYTQGHAPSKSVLPLYLDLFSGVIAGDLNPITLKPFPVPVLQIPSSLTPQMTPTPNANPLEGSNSLKKSWQPQRRSSEGKMSGDYAASCHHLDLLMNGLMHNLVFKANPDDCQQTSCSR